MLFKQISVIMFDLSYLQNFITVIGIYALIVYLIDNLKSVVLIVKSILEPFFLPHVKTSLIEKYGTWAGEFFPCFI